MTEKEVELVVEKTIIKLRQHGLLRRDDEVAYTEIKNRLYDNYKYPGDDPALDAAIDHFSDDPYFGILDGIFLKRMTQEELAEQYGCEPRTISRNKKRLCIDIWLELRSK